jgi:hypothetical protein
LPSAPDALYKTYGMPNFCTNIKISIKFPSSLYSFQGLNNHAAQHVLALIGHVLGQPILKETLHNLHKIF